MTAELQPARYTVWKARFLTRIYSKSPMERSMKTNWQHQKDAINTDKAQRTDDEHINEEDKQNLKASDELEREMNPGKTSSVPAPKSVRDGKRGGSAR
jgi:hypothetical protein